MSLGIDTYRSEQLHLGILCMSLNLVYTVDGRDSYVAPLCPPTVVPN